MTSLRIWRAPDVLDGDAGGGAGDQALGSAVEGIHRHGVFGGDGMHEFGLLGRGGEDPGNVGIGEDVPDLDGGVRFVDRDGDRADRQESEVQEKPFVRGRGEDRDRVCRLDAKADEAAGCVLDLTLKLARGQ